MGDREALFDEDAVCDACGAKGAYDFMGDHFCSKCAKEAGCVTEPCGRCGCEPCRCGEECEM